MFAICLNELTLNNNAYGRYNMTKFAIYLNELTPGLKDKVAPTDSRLRPDQHALEEGVYDQVQMCFVGQLRASGIPSLQKRT